MTTYRLPDWLGGHEVKRLTDASTPGRVNVTLSKGEGLIIEIDLKDLTEVQPTLPEPPTGTVFSNGADAVIRCDSEIDDDGRWYTTDYPDYQRWEDIAEAVTGPGWRRYIPDPADDAPAQAVLDAAQAWVAYVHNASSPPNLWGDDHDFKLIGAVDAYNAAREVEQP